MEGFKTILFGISGLSVIFWVSVMTIWHVDMFPKIFAKDTLVELNIKSSSVRTALEINSLSSSGSLRPNKVSKGLLDRGIYSRRSFVVANFSPAEASYSVNRLYTSVILSLSVMSFLFLCYGLQSILRIFL